MIAIEEKNKEHFHFVLKNEAGTAVFKSTRFLTEDAALSTLSRLSIRHGTYAQFERQTDHSGRFLYQLKSPSGERLGKSATFSSEAGMENGIKHFRLSLQRWQQEPS